MRSPRSPILRRAAGVALAAALLAPAAASADTVSLEGDVLVLRTEPGRADHASVYPDAEVNGEATGAIELRGKGMRAWPGVCRADQYGDEDSVDCAPQPGGVRIETGDGDDFVAIAEDLPDGQAVVAVAGDGNDRIVGRMRGNTRRDVLDGGAGDDQLDGSNGPEALLGGPGTDVLKGGAGADELRGGEGDDNLKGDSQNQAFGDVVDGGPGYDKVDNDWRADTGTRQPPISVTLDGVADDGRTGERDNVTGIEEISLTAPATLVAGPDPVTFKIFNSANVGSKLVGSAGPDILEGFDWHDTIQAGAGADTVEGGYGDDTLDPGPGADSVIADAVDGCNFLQCRMPQGNDTVLARDGERDSIDCGVGTDRAVVDPIDVVAGCETVETGGPGPGPGPDGTPGPDDPGGQAGAKRCTVPKVTRRARLKATRKRLAKAGCKVKVVRVRSKRVARGRVVRVSHRKGAKAKTVKVYVSRGRR